MSWDFKALVMTLVRWITENEYTSFSCFHTDCFGCAVGFAECMRLSVDAGEDVDLLAVSKQWAGALKAFHYMPLAEAKKEADEGIASGLKTGTIWGYLFLGNLPKHTLVFIGVLFHPFLD